MIRSMSIANRRKKIFLGVQVSGCKSTGYRVADVYWDPERGEEELNVLLRGTDICQRALERKNKSKRIASWIMSKKEDVS